MFLEITFIEPDNDESLGLRNERVGRVVVTRDVIDCPTLVLQWSLVLGVYNPGAQCVGRTVVHIYICCASCRPVHLRCSFYSNWVHVILNFIDVAHSTRVSPLSFRWPRPKPPLVFLM